MKVSNKIENLKEEKPKVEK